MHCSICHQDNVSPEHLKKCDSEVKILNCPTCISERDVSSVSSHINLHSSSSSSQIVQVFPSIQEIIACQTQPLILSLLEDNKTASAILRWFRKQNIPVIKVLIPRSNAFGHKVASILVAKRLVELQICPNIILVPEDLSVQAEVEIFLSMIQPGFKWGNTYKCYNVTISAYSGSIQALKGGGIGMTGGFDGQIVTIQKLLNVEDVIMLQPPAWKAFCQLSVNCPKPVKIQLEKAAYYIRTNYVPREVLSQYPHCQLITTSMFQKGVLLCPIYGLHHSSVNDNALSCVASAMGYLCQKINKVGVIVVIGNYQIKKIQAPNPFKIVDEHNANAIDTFIHNSKNKGSTLIVCAGKLPTEVFNMLLSTCNMPFLFEGAGTLSLALNAGKPYIRLLGNDMDGNYYPAIPGYERVIQRLDMLGGGIAFSRLQPEIISQVYYFFLFCYIRPKKSHEYFKALRKHYHKITRDKVFLGLVAWCTGQENFSDEKALRLLKELKLIKP